MVFKVYYNLDLRIFDFVNVFLVSHFYHEPLARETGQPLPVYLTVNKLYLYLYYPWRQMYLITLRFPQGNGVLYEKSIIDQGCSLKITEYCEEYYTLNVWSRGKQLVLFSREF